MSTGGPGDQGRRTMALTLWPSLREGEGRAALPSLCFFSLRPSSLSPTLSHPGLQLPVSLHHFPFLPLTLLSLTLQPSPPRPILPVKRISCFLILSSQSSQSHLAAFPPSFPPFLRVLLHPHLSLELPSPLPPSSPPPVSPSAATHPFTLSFHLASLSPT